MKNERDLTGSAKETIEASRRVNGEMKSALEIGFDDLIAPLTTEEFLSAYWEKKPLVSSGKPPEFFTPLFSTRDVDRAISFFRPRPGRIDLVTEQGFVRDNYSSPDGTANINLVMESYLKGSTVVLSGLEQTWEPLAIFAGKLEGSLNHPVAMAVYLSPPRFQGVTPHYDTQENFLIQVEGSKQWKVYEPVYDLPPVEGSYATVPRDKLSPPICEAVLKPGDVLYIPRGFVHEGIAGDKPSLHITVDIHVRTWHDFLSDALAAQAERNPRYRRALPAGFLNDERIMQSLAAEFEEFMDTFRRDARTKDAVWKHTEALAVRKPPPADGHFSMLNLEIGPETAFKKRRTSLVRVFEEDGMAGIQFSGNHLFGPSKISNALKFIADADTITPASLPGPLNESEKLVLIRRLVRAGLLTLA
ncbi:MAG TPA: cupin domain-containing protein [Pyrinomonadaceae bacterium]